MPGLEDVDRVSIQVHGCRDDQANMVHLDCSNRANRVIEERMGRGNTANSASHTLFDLVLSKLAVGSPIDSDRDGLREARVAVSARYRDWLRMLMRVMDMANMRGRIRPVVRFLA